jgi:hypothetical protein
MQLVIVSSGYPIMRANFYLSRSWAAIRTHIGELTNISAVQIHDEDLVLVSGTWSERHKKYFTPVCRPRRSSAAPARRRVTRILRREIDLLVPVGVHSEDGTVPFMEAHERDVPPVRRPNGHLRETGCDLTG